MNVAIIVQARLGSKRLPQKVLAEVYKDGDGRSVSMIEAMVRRLWWGGPAPCFTGAVLACPREDVEAFSFLSCVGPFWDVHGGSETDVLGRFYDAARYAKADVVVRLTGDCPLVSAAVVRAMVTEFVGAPFDYYSNAHPVRTVPKGFDVEVFTMDALRWSHQHGREPHYREHVTSLLYQQYWLEGSGMTRSYARRGTWTPDKALPNDLPNLSVDTQDDLDRVREVFKALGPNCTMDEVVEHAVRQGWRKGGEA